LRLRREFDRLDGDCFDQWQAGDALLCVNGGLHKHAGARQSGRRNPTAGDEIASRQRLR